MKKALFRIVLLPFVVIGLMGTTLDRPMEMAAGKVRSVTQWVTENADGKDVTYKDEYEEFDKQGNRISRINFKKDGSVSSRETWAWDKFGNMIEKVSTEEVKPEKGGTSYDHKTFRYNAHRDKIEECELNKEGIVKSKTVYTYNASGKKSMEQIYDKDGNMKKKVSITYNKQNDVVQKLTTNAKGDTLKIQKHVYIYF